MQCVCKIEKEAVKEFPWISVRRTLENMPGMCSTRSQVPRGDVRKNSFKKKISQFHLCSPNKEKKKKKKNKIENDRSEPEPDGESEDEGKCSPPAASHDTEAVTIKR